MFFVFVFFFLVFFFCCCCCFAENNIGFGYESFSTLNVVLCVIWVFRARVYMAFGYFKVI